MFDNVTRIRFAMQKRSPRNFNLAHPERTPASYCKCSQYQRYCDPGPIKRGETIIIISRRIFMHTNTDTGIKTGYYRNERWRVECLSKVMLIMGNVFGMKNMLLPLKKDMKRDGPGSPPTLREVWRLSDKDIALRERLQRRASTYRTRLKKYEENPEPSNKTIKAIINCKLKIQIAETAIKAQLTAEPTMEPGFQGE